MSTMVFHYRAELPLEELPEARVVRRYYELPPGRKAPEKIDEAKEIYIVEALQRIVEHGR